MSDDAIELPPPRETTGQAPHAGNADAQWLAVTSFPDFCKVGDDIVGFDTTAALDNPVRHSANVVLAGQPAYRVGDLCRGTQGNAGAGVVSGTSGDSGHVLFLTGQDDVVINGQALVRQGSECRINCNAAGVGGAKGYVYTTTASVSRRRARKPPSEAERFQQQADALAERADRLREALNDNPNGKSLEQAQALQAEVEQLIGETEAQQEALMEAIRAGRLEGDALGEALYDVEEAAQRANELRAEAGRQVRWAAPGGRIVGEFVAETFTPYGTGKDVYDTAQLFSEERYGAAAGMSLLTAVSIFPPIRGIRKVDEAADAVGGAKRADATNTDGVHVAPKRDGGSADDSVIGSNGAGNYRPDRKLPRDKHGNPVPDSDAPHTQLGTKKGRNGDYTQGREWDYDSNGKLAPKRDVDFTDHGRPQNHPNPHQHDWVPNPTGGTPQHGPAKPLEWP